MFDAIVTDPPYGVRAGAKRIGSSIIGKSLSTEPRVLEGGLLAHLKPTYIPPMRAYEISDLAYDLVRMAQFLLRPGGRLVFFLPTVTEDYSEVDLPSCEGMTLIGNSVQEFGKWARRLITMEKDVQSEAPAKLPTFEDRVWMKKEQEAVDSDKEHVPAHHDFRGKYSCILARQCAS